MEASGHELPPRGPRRSLRSVRSIAELGRRPGRRPNYASENRAFVILAQALATSPDSILQKLADTALAICRAHSAGISLLSEDRKRFHWPAIAGLWVHHVGGGPPRASGPCGAVLDRNAALVFSHPEWDFPYFAELQPCVEDGLLIPFYIKGEAVGTIWVVSHDRKRRFDAEDLRVMTNLGAFAAAAYQNLLSVRASQQNASIVESSEDAIISKDLNGIITTWNRGAEQLFGYRAEEAIGRSVTILIPPDNQDEERRILEGIARGERIEHYETIRRRKDGTLVPISLTVSPVRNSAGEITGASKIARDISERRRAEEQIQVLAHEVDHRSKNMLALVQATVRLAQADTLDALKTTILGRIGALANAHDLLTRSDWVGADIDSLAMHEFSPYCLEGEPRVEIRGPSLIMKSKSAQFVAIAFHELTTNAVKYGALSVRGGHVRVEWSRAPDGSLLIVWTELDGPAITSPSHRGFGSRVIEKIVRDQLNGKVSFDWRAEGLVCKLRLDPNVDT